MLSVVGICISFDFRTNRLGEQQGETRVITCWGVVLRVILRGFGAWALRVGVGCFICLWGSGFPGVDLHHRKYDPTTPPGFRDDIRLVGRSRVRTAS